MNSDGRFLGPITFQQGLVHSRNTVTVKLLMDVGIENTIETARKMGIGSPLGRNLSLSLGAAEVTPLELTAAYSVFPNLGTRVQPVLVKKVLDRYGRVLEDNTSEPIQINQETLSDKQASAWLEQRRATPFPSGDYQLFQDGTGQPNYQQYGDQYDSQLERYWQQSYGRNPGAPMNDRQAEWRNRPVPEAAEPQEIDQAPPLRNELEALLSLPKRFVYTGKVSRRPDPKRVLSPQTAYLMTSILRKVCVSGTAAKATRMKRRDIAGKTGTTDDSTDAWFIGFNPHYTTGIWVGYDAKVSLGRKEYGSRAALPIWMEFMSQALSGEPNGEYLPPRGIVYWEADPRQRPNLVTLLESSPDLGQEFPSKRTSPVDMEAGALPTYASGMYGGFSSPMQMYGTSRVIDPYTGQPMPAGPPMGNPMASNSFYDYHPGTIRVLSPRGDTLGHAPYSVDEKGRVVVYREMLSPVADTSLHLGDDDRYRGRAGPDQQERGEQRGPQEQSHPLQSLVQGANRLYRDLRGYVPQINPFGWTQ